MPKRLHLPPEVAAELASKHGYDPRTTAVYETDDGRIGFSPGVNIAETGGEAFGKSALEGAGYAGGGLLAAMGAGAATGAGVGTLFGPGVGTAAGAIVGAGAGLATPWLAKKAYRRLQSSEGRARSEFQEQQYEKEHPVASSLGHITGSLPFMVPGGYKALATGASKLINPSIWRTANITADEVANVLATSTAAGLNVPRAYEVMNRDDLSWAEKLAIIGPELATIASKPGPAGRFMHNQIAKITKGEKLLDPVQKAQEGEEMRKMAESNEALRKADESRKAADLKRPGLRQQEGWLEGFELTPEQQQYSDLMGKTAKDVGVEKRAGEKVAKSEAENPALVEAIKGLEEENRRGLGENPEDAALDVPVGTDEGGQMSLFDYTDPSGPQRRLRLSGEPAPREPLRPTPEVDEARIKALKDAENARWKEESNRQLEEADRAAAEAEAAAERKRVEEEGRRKLENQKWVDEQNFEAQKQGWEFQTGRRLRGNEGGDSQAERIAAEYEKAGERATDADVEAQLKFAKERGLNVKFDPNIPRKPGMAPDEYNPAALNKKTAEILVDPFDPSATGIYHEAGHGQTEVFAGKRLGKSFAEEVRGHGEEDVATIMGNIARESGAEGLFQRYGRDVVAGLKSIFGKADVFDTARVLEANVRKNPELGRQMIERAAQLGAEANGREYMVARYQPGFGFKKFNLPNDPNEYMEVPIKAGSFDPKKFVGDKEFGDLLKKPTLYKAVPGLERLKVAFDPSFAGGRYNPETTNTRVGTQGNTLEENLRILLHETGHGVAGRQGLPGGSNPDKTAWEINQKELPIIEKVFDKLVSQGKNNEAAELNDAITDIAAAQTAAPHADNGRAAVISAMQKVNRAVSDPTDRAIILASFKEMMSNYARYRMTHGEVLVDTAQQRDLNPKDYAHEPFQYTFKDRMTQLSGLSLSPNPMVDTTLVTSRNPFVESVTSAPFNASDYQYQTGRRRLGANEPTDQPSAEPLGDIKAQLDELGINPRRAGVYVPATAIAQHNLTPEHLRLISGMRPIEPNFDGKGGSVVFDSEYDQRHWVKLRDAGHRMQLLLGMITGAGEGPKPVGDVDVHQTRTPEGAVVQESNVPKGTPPEPGQVALTPEETQARRQAGIAQESARRYLDSISEPLMKMWNEQMPGISKPGDTPTTVIQDINTSRQESYARIFARMIAALSNGQLNDNQAIRMVKSLVNMEPGIYGEHNDALFAATDTPKKSEREFIDSLGDPLRIAWERELPISADREMTIDQMLTRMRSMEDQHDLQSYGRILGREVAKVSGGRVSEEQGVRIMKNMLGAEQGRFADANREVDLPLRSEDPPTDRPPRTMDWGVAARITMPFLDAHPNIHDFRLTNEDFLIKEIINEDGTTRSATAQEQKDWRDFIKAKMTTGTTPPVGAREPSESSYTRSPGRLAPLEQQLMARLDHTDLVDRWRMLGADIPQGITSLQEAIESIRGRHDRVTDQKNITRLGLVINSRASAIGEHVPTPQTEDMARALYQLPPEESPPAQAPMTKAEGNKLLAEGWQDIAAQPGRFRYGRLGERSRPEGTETWKKVMKEFSTPKRKLGYTPAQHGDSPMVTTPEGEMSITEHRKRVGVNSMDAGSSGKEEGGGGQAYQGIMTYAKQTGKKYQAGGLTWINRLRAVSNGISSALRHGTTEHLDLGPYVPGWTDGDHVNNIANALRQESQLAHERINGLKNLTIDEHGNVANKLTGETLDNAKLLDFIKIYDEAMRQGLTEGLKGVGVTTAKRAIMTREMVSPEGLKAVPEGQLLYQSARRQPGEALKGWLRSVLDAASNEADARGIKSFRPTLRRFYAEKFRMQGIGNKALDAMIREDRSVLRSAMDKRNEAYKTRTPPAYTPEELRAVAAFHNAMVQYQVENNKIPGRSGGFDPHYVPHMISMDQLAKMVKDPLVFRKKILKDIIDENMRINPSNIPAEIEEHFHEYFNALSAGEQPGDFAALTKKARKYILSDSARETDPLQLMDRYSRRASRDIARATTVEQVPEVADALHIGHDLKPGEVKPGKFPITAEMTNQRDDVYGNLSNPAYSDRKFYNVYKGFQNATTGAMIQTLTGAKNILQMAPQIGRTVNVRDLGAVMEGLMRPMADYNGIRQRAIDSGAYASAHATQQFAEDEPLIGGLAKNMSKVGDVLRTMTGSKKLEELSRVLGFSVGEQLAARHLGNPKDKQAADFIEKYGQNLTDADSHMEKIQKMAANYTRAQQTSYSGEDVPAWMLRPTGKAAAVRLMKYGVANYNRTIDTVVKPAMQGNFMPLIMMLGGSYLSYEMIEKLNEYVSGVQASHPTMDEINKGVPEEQQARRMGEYALNLLDVADKSGTFGAVSQILGTVGRNIRGQKQQLLANPEIEAGKNLMLHAAQGIKRVGMGDDPLDAMTDAFKGALTSTVQDARVIRDFMQTAEQKQTRADVRSRRTFGYLQGYERPDVSEVVGGLIKGNLYGPATESQLMQQLVDSGSRDESSAALKRLQVGKNPVEVEGALARGFSHPGLYSDTTENDLKNRDLLQFIEATRGEGEAGALIGRARGRRDRLRSNVRQALGRE